MSIDNIIIFISSASQKCTVPIKYASKYKLQIRWVRLDTEESRNMARNGKYFQITSVPTMIINYTDSNIQMFIGVEKIMKILQNLVRHLHNPERNARDPLRGPRTDEDDKTNLTGINMYDTNTKIIPSKQPYAPRTSIPSTRPDSQNVIVYNDDSEDDDFGSERGPPRATIIDDDSEDEDVVVNKKSKKSIPTAIDQEEEPVNIPSKRSQVKSRKNAKSKKKGKKKPVIFDEEESITDEQNNEIEIEYEPQIKQEKGKKSRMQNLIDAAKQMEHDRKDSLGYNEADLPHY
jgi:hypothetical protein